MKATWQSTGFRLKNSKAIEAAWARGGALRSEKTRQKQSKARKASWRDPEYRARRSGKNNHFWRDGSTRDWYPPEFNEALKQAVRERDGFICVLCGEPQNGRALDVHHIDGDKHNNEMTNLISLDSSCHSIVHARGDSDYWRVGFQQMMKASN